MAKKWPNVLPPVLKHTNDVTVPIKIAHCSKSDYEWLYEPPVRNCLPSLI